MQYNYDTSISNHLHFHNSNKINKENNFIVNPSAICNIIRNTLYDNQGQLSINLILGGYSYVNNKATLVAIHPHGSIDYNIPYAALGSGSLSAMSILESKYTSTNITTDDAISLVQDAVLCGITNDLGSGSQVDICIINKDGYNYTRNVIKEEILLHSIGDAQMLQRLKDRDTSTTSSITGDEKTFMKGVSGFGSLPFIMKRRKKDSSSTIKVLGEDFLERNKLLNDILDL